MLVQAGHLRRNASENPTVSADPQLPAANKMPEPDRTGA